MKVRIKFAKYGTMKFIGHLDMMRFFQKAIRRAGIDVAYSNGFSPHQLMAFAAPLGVGLASNGEYMDIEINSMVSCQDIRERLNHVSVPGIEVLSVKQLPDSAENAMASVAAASYLLQKKEGDYPVDGLTGKLAAFLAQDTIPYTKETKKGVAELNLKEGIYELEAENGSAIRMLVNASSSGNIKPGMVMEAFSAFAGVEIPPGAYRIIKLETYMDPAADDKDRQGSHRWIPLDAVQ